MLNDEAIQSDASTRLGAEFAPLMLQLQRAFPDVPSSFHDRPPPDNPPFTSAEREILTAMDYDPSEGMTRQGDRFMFQSKSGKTFEMDLSSGSAQISIIERDADGREQRFPMSAVDATQLQRQAMEISRLDREIARIDREIDGYTETLSASMTALSRTLGVSSTLSEDDMRNPDALRRQASVFQERIHDDAPKTIEGIDGEDIPIDPPIDAMKERIQSAIDELVAIIDRLEQSLKQRAELERNRDEAIARHQEHQSQFRKQFEKNSEAVEENARFWDAA